MKSDLLDTGLRDSDSALLTPIKPKKECEYCDGKLKPLFCDEEDGICLDAYIQNKSLVVSRWDICEIYSQKIRQKIINFCPMCGRKLKD